MKTQEEIEQLAKIIVPTPMEGTSYINVRNGFIQGYTQCQEDNKDKKYTERQLREAISESWNSCEDNENGETFTQVFDRIINSLNKQDNEN